MAQVSFIDLYFSYEGNQENIFENFSVSFDTRWKLGLIARNGRGKTTLLKLLSNQLQPTKGAINLQHGSVPAMFPPPIDYLTKDITKIVVCKATPEIEEWRLFRELSLLEVHVSLLERPFRTLSPGEQGKILLAALFAKEDAYVLLDEPGNHLDGDGKQILTTYLSGKKGFLLVSHERDLLDATTDHTMALLKSGPEIVAGPYRIWAAHRKNVEEFERTENKRLEKEIALLGESARRTGQWAEKSHRESTKDDGSGVKFGLKEKKRAKTMKLDRRAKQTIRQKERAATEKKKLLHDIEENAPLKMNPLHFHRDCLVSATNLGFGYGDKILLQDASFRVCRGERLCLTGRNGAGKSTLLKMISGATPSTALTVKGELYIPKGIKISVLPQMSELPSIQLMDFMYQRNLDTTKVLMLLRKMDFPREIFQGNISDFSSGQKRKLLIAMSICEEAHLYLWDEPLNFLDIQSREQVEEVLLSANPTLIFAEHDAYFCQKIATKYIRFQGTS